jgi:uncharacterized protein YvpB
MKIFRLFVIVAALFVLVMTPVSWLKATDETVFAAESYQSASRTSDDTIGGKLTSLSGQITDLTAQRFELKHPTGWQIIDGQRVYLEKGEPKVGQLTQEKVTYTFDEEGHWLSTRLNAPYISQLPDMPSGCEVVSVTMMLNYAGISVTKEEVAEVLPYAFDANLGFTGSLYDDGYSAGVVWPPALLDLVTSYVGSAVDLTDASWEDICEYLEAGKPVCIWFSANGLDHTVLLTGYSDTTVWYNDPLAEKDVELDLDTFLLWWSGNYNHALSY